MQKAVRMQLDAFEVVLLTGFLGSGKTTLLKTFLERGDSAETGVIVNEIGEIDVDGAVLAQSAQKVPLALLSNGCICCAGDGDLAGAVAMLQEERARRGFGPLRRVIVETSGAARPGPVLRGLQLLGPRAKVSCLVTFDAIHWQRALRTREGRSQVAGAQRIVVTKQECVSAEQADEALAAARAANPLAEVLATPFAMERALYAFAPQRSHSMPITSPADADAGLASDDQRITTALIKISRPIELEALAAWLDNAAGLLGERLYRTKGVVRIRGLKDAVLVQGVGTTFAQPLVIQPGNEASFLVLIAESLALDELHSIEPQLPAGISLGKRSRAIGRRLAETIGDLVHA